MTIYTDDGGTFDNSLDYHMDLTDKYAQNTKTQDVQKTVSDVADRYGVSPAFKQGLFYNINAESGWDPYNRHVDQPRFGGEAHYSHGLFQEGGGATKPLFDYAISKGKVWTDPEVQTEFALENMKSRGLLNKYGQTQDWREAAKGIASDYLKPSAVNLGKRIADIEERPYINVVKYPKYQDAVIDRSHDVPLLAGGLQDDSGNTYGTSIDRNIPHYHTIDGVTFDTAQFVHGHEMEEIKHMDENLLPSGMGSAEAYTKAHNEVATPHELNEVKAFAESKGKDPEKFAASYQQFWKDQLGNIKDKVPEKVHKDLYLHPYEGHQLQSTIEELAGRTVAQQRSQMTHPASMSKPPAYTAEEALGALPGIGEAIGMAKGTAQAIKQSGLAEMAGEHDPKALWEAIPKGGNQLVKALTTVGLGLLGGQLLQESERAAASALAREAESQRALSVGSEAVEQHARDLEELGITPYRWINKDVQDFEIPKAANENLHPDYFDIVKGAKDRFNKDPFGGKESTNISKSAEDEEFTRKVLERLKEGKKLGFDADEIRNMLSPPKSIEQQDYEFEVEFQRAQRQREAEIKAKRDLIKPVK